MVLTFLILYDFQNFVKSQSVRQIEEDEEPPIKKLPPEVLGVIFANLEYENVQKFKNVSKFLLNAHKSERRMITGPTCDAHVYYNKNKELRLEITMMVSVLWIRILPFRRRIALTRTIPLNKWNYYFKNAKCKKFGITVEEEAIPLKILNKILCCKSIHSLTYSGKSINQMTIDLLAAYKPQHFKIITDDWKSQIMLLPKHTAVLIECLTNIDDVVEAIKLAYNSIISLRPEYYEKNEHSLMRLKHNTDHKPFYLFHFDKNTNRQKVLSIKHFLENSISDVHGFYMECRLMHSTTRLYMMFKVL